MAVADTHLVPRVETCGLDSSEQTVCRESVEDVVHGVPADAGNDGADRFEDAIGIGVRVLVRRIEHRQTLSGHAKTGCA